MTIDDCAHAFAVIVLVVVIAVATWQVLRKR